MVAEPIKVEQVIERDGEVVLTGLPFRKGDRVRVLVTPDDEVPPRQHLTARDLLESGLADIWSDRDDIGDSVEFARKLREAAQRPEQ